MPADDLEEFFVRKFILELGALELARVKELIPSKTLRNAVVFIPDNRGGGRLYIPHYWAEYYHDGREGFGVDDNEWLVYFADPADDPRIAGGYPVREDDVNTLTKEQWEEGLEKNAERDPDDPYMIVVRSVGPFKPGVEFFVKLAQGASERASALSTRMLEDYKRELLATPEGRHENKDIDFNF
jgi:hypothetical protein